jgi:DNA damage-inducible protein 1
MLKAHQACIDLEKNVLRIQGREVRFLPEHELPEKSREPVLSEAVSPRDSSPVQGSRGGGGAPTAGSSSQPRPTSRYPEAKIQTLVDLGVSREVAISTLDAAGGNVDVAASLLF